MTQSHPLQHQRRPAKGRTLCRSGWREPFPQGQRPRGKPSVSHNCEIHRLFGFQPVKGLSKLPIRPDRLFVDGDDDITSQHPRLSLDDHIQFAGPEAGLCSRYFTSLQWPSLHHFGCRWARNQHCYPQDRRCALPQGSLWRSLPRNRYACS